MGFFDLAKIGFGAVVGLLGGKKLQAGNDQQAAHGREVFRLLGGTMALKYMKSLLATAARRENWSC